MTAMLIALILQDVKPCDLKKVEKAPYCETCDAIDPKLNDEGACASCDGAIAKIDVCVKTYFVCAGCDHKMAEEKACCEGKKFEKAVAKCRIVFRCEGCGSAGEADGADCWDEECNKAGKKVKRTCADTGHWPHGGAAPKKKE